MDGHLASSHFEFLLRTRVRFGSGEGRNLARYLQELPLARVGLVVDAGVADQPYVREIVGAVKDAYGDRVITWVYDLGAEPDYGSLDRIRTRFLDRSGKSSVDGFVGMGGGSVIDFAKGLATLAVNPGEAIRYRGFPQGIVPSLPTVAVPTTAGTGSEVTYNAVFIDWGSSRKLGINTVHNFPALTILDPDLVATCPRRVLLSTGADALVHTLESYAARGANPLTRVFAREAFFHVHTALTELADRPESREAVAHLQMGAYLAGISLMNAGSGPAGALSYPLGVRFRVPHGIAGGVFLPYLVAHNVEKGYDYRELHDRVVPGAGEKDSAAVNRAFAALIRDLCRKIGIPEDLGAFGVTRENAGPLLADIDSLAAAFAQNPVSFTVEDGKAMVQRLIGGERARVQES